MPTTRLAAAGRLTGTVFFPTGMSKNDPVLPSWTAAASGAEEHEPDDRQSEYRGDRADDEQRRYRRPGFSLTRLGRRLNDLTVLLCHHIRLKLHVRVE